MKTTQTIQKNFKLLFRSKETAFTIIFGPLLIILLVGFAFSGDDTMRLNIGVHAQEYTELTDEFVESLQEEYVVSIHSTKEECVTSIERGDNQLCIGFPEDFRIREDATSTVTFHVDPSRINLVYQVIASLSERFDAQREQISLGLTSNILANVDVTRQLLGEQVENAQRISELRAQASDALQATNERTRADDINFTVIDFRILRGSITGMEQDIQQLHTRGLDEFSNAQQALRSAKSACNNCSNATNEQIDQAIDELELATIYFSEVHDRSPQRLRELTQLVETAAERVNNIQTSYGEVQEDLAHVQEQITTAQQTLEEMRERLTDLRANLRYANDLLLGLESADSASVVTPIRTQIEEVTLEDNLSFTYPYILMLVIMFMGLMLGSTLIVTDKNSKAAFRNFTTATRDEFHILLSFITTLLILLAQVTIILVFSSLIITAPLLSNFLTTIIIILLAITLFSFLGMMVGYLAKSQEAAMITSLTIGSVMLFVSNLVIPIESMNALVRGLANLNPYVVLSEVLKKSMLFDMPLREFFIEVFLVFVLAIILLATTIGVQQYVRRRYFKEQAVVEVKTKKAVQPLELGAHVIKDEFELLSALDVMTREEFKKHVNEEKNKVYSWAKKELNNKWLARKLNTTNKERMIIKLDKYLKKQTRKQVKK